MRRSRRMLAWLAGPILPGIVLGFLLTVSGCSQRAGVPSDETTGQRSEPTIPQPPSLSQGVRGGDESAGMQGGSTASGAANLLEAQSLPAGTLLTVRLKNALAAAAANGSFEAIVDDAVILDGETRVPTGTVVEGRVESFRTSDVKPERALVELTLSSIHLGEMDVPVRTASLFGRQTAAKSDAASALLLEKGRRLTFRFTEPVYIPAQRTRAGR